jgi:transcription elongation factor GreA
MEKFPMTPAGYARLEQQLEQLRRVERPSIVAAIEEARAHGDLKENAEYHAAKEKQGHIEGRIMELQTRIAHAQVVNPASLRGGRISFGATVRLLDLDTDEELTYAIVGESEANFKAGLLNFRSPIAQALLGKEEGDEVKVDTGAQTRSFEILSVAFQPIELV